MYNKTIASYSVNLFEWIDKPTFRYAHPVIRTRVVVISGPTRYRHYGGVSATTTIYTTTNNNNDDDDVDDDDDDDDDDDNNTNNDY